MNIICAKDYDDMSRQAANLIASQVIRKKDSILGLATGSTPIGTYRRLIDGYEYSHIDYSRVRTINLDEYAGLSPDHEQSYARFMRINLFDHINIDPQNTNIPDGLAKDAEQECMRYDALIHTLGGIDLQLLGIGHNGHIGFNEPGEFFHRKTHVVELSESTIQANKRFFDHEEDVPRHAYTMGILDIFQAKSIVMLASGLKKAEIVLKAFFGPITPHVPASVLQLHPDLTLIVDIEAGSLLP